MRQLGPRVSPPMGHVAIGGGALAMGVGLLLATVSVAFAS
jgi:hypothetical protein